jgi:hypothetical protein
MDELQLTRRLFAEPDPDPEAKDRARARLEVVTNPAPRPHVWHRLGLIAAALAGVLALQVILPPGASGPARSAATELRRLATVAAGRTPESGGLVAYGLYEEYALVEGQDLRGGAPFVAFVRRDVEYWRHPNGSVRSMETVHRIDFPSDHDRIGWQQVGGPPPPGEGESLIHDLGPGSTEFEDLSRYPHEPHQLLAAIRSNLAEAPTDDRQALVAITWLLSRGDADPPLRAALFEAAALLPAIELIDEVSDRHDRQGEGVMLETESERMLLIVDPATSLPLGYELTTSEGPAAGITSWRVYIANGRVQRIGDVPEAGG